MPSQRFKIQSFAVLSIAATSHGCELVRQIQTAGLRPKFALIFGQPQFQWDQSRHIWTRVGSWGKEKIKRSFLYTRSLCNREKFVDEPMIEKVYKSAGIPYRFVPGLESDTVVKLLKEGDVDAVLLAEGPILKGPILSCVPQGIINVHPAPLPEYRGNYSTYWALYHDEPLYVSAHLVTKDVDMGPIILRSPLPVHRGDSLKDIDRRGFTECGKLAAEVLSKGLHEGLPVHPQKDWQGRTFRGQMPKDIIHVLEQRLKRGEYSHYV